MFWSFIWVLCMFCSAYVFMVQHWIIDLILLVILWWGFMPANIYNAVYAVPYFAPS